MTLVAAADFDTATLIFGGLLVAGSVLLTVSRSIRSIPLLAEVEAV